MNEFITLFLVLIGLHCIADYPLQGDFLANGKDLTNPLPSIPWYQCMLAHCSIHGLFVGIALQDPFLGIIEFLAHFYIDCLKCVKVFNYNQDQFLHIFCKLMWIAIYMLIHSGGAA
jgi:hypothetical protein